MNLRLLLLLGLFPFWTFAQDKLSKPQIAFNYYVDSILPQKTYERIYVKPKLVNHFSSWNIGCLDQLDLTINDTAVALVNPTEIRKSLRIPTNDKIKSGSTKQGCNVFVTRELKLGSDRFVTAIVESFGDTWFSYIFEIDSAGNIKKWCSGSVNNH